MIDSFCPDPIVQKESQTISVATRKVPGPAPVESHEGLPSAAKMANTHDSVHLSNNPPSSIPQASPNKMTQSQSQKTFVNELASKNS